MYHSRIRPILALLPADTAEALARLDLRQQDRLEELRFRTGCEISAVIDGEETPLELRRPLVCQRKTLEHLFNAACGYSAYAAVEALREGYLPLPGGHRLGFCGTAVVTDGKVSTLKELSSANLRIASQRTGCASGLLEQLGPTPDSTLILGPPGCGKTTLLRDLVRQMSDRLGFRMGVVDSRGELAACLDGQPQLQIGRRTDVVSLIPKADGMELLLRAMNPQWIAVDEITAAADLEAMIHAGYCGVRLLATAHAFDRSDLDRRPLYRQLTEMGLFRNLVVLNREKQYQLERMD